MRYKATTGVLTLLGGSPDGGRIPALLATGLAEVSLA